MALPKLDAGTPKLSADPERPLHFVPVWDQRRYDMVAGIRPGSGGSAWTNETCTACGKTTADVEAVSCFGFGQLLPRPLVRGADGNIRLITGFRRSSYARMSPGRPAATITTASGRIGSDRTIHPWQTRVLSPLECQLLQTFPVGFKWGDTLARFGHTNIRAMIGEALPPHFTEIWHN
ncbi:DNA cytosine methyltransferase [Mycobacterium hackensackense]|uniref:DNA cytosine methyltransferase n=1 Tax=Mycobacterium hackensackense TaxID=228909 RepID=UPI003556F321|nr:DNA cytosine methyltransferase [Mycobacterium hackensackense]